VLFEKALIEKERVGIAQEKISQTTRRNFGNDFPRSIRANTTVFILQWHRPRELVSQNLRRCAYARLLPSERQPIFMGVGVDGGCMVAVWWLDGGSMVAGWRLE
jgi:hypothetical protein